MFRTSSGEKHWPELNVQVIGIYESEDGFDILAWCTRTDDGWYASDTRGNLGHRDTMRKEDSKGPTLWMHAPPKPMNN